MKTYYFEEKLFEKIETKIRKKLSDEKMKEKNAEIISKYQIGRNLLRNF